MFIHYTSHPSYVGALLAAPLMLCSLFSPVLYFPPTPPPPQSQEPSLRLCMHKAMYSSSGGLLIIELAWWKDQWPVGFVQGQIADQSCPTVTQSSVQGVVRSHELTRMDVLSSVGVTMAVLMSEIISRMILTQFRP